MENITTLKHIPPTWDEFFMLHVYLVASKSKDPSTQIGAIIVKDNILLSEGYNGFCRGVDDNVEERWKRPDKYSWIEHGERNSIFNAARNGIKTLDTTMFTNGLPCVDCARSVIQAGIKEIVLHSPWEKYWIEIMKDKWKEHDAISSKMFEEAKVKIRYKQKDWRKI
jgi:dCMP deaminase